MSTVAGGALTKLASQAEWTLSLKKDLADTTSFSDTNKTSVVGLADVSGTFSGYYDTDDTVLATANNADAGVTVVLYPDYPTTLTKYATGTGNIDLSYSIGATGAEKVSGNFSARDSWKISL